MLTCGKSSLRCARQIFRYSSCQTIARNLVTMRSGNARTPVSLPRANGRPSPKAGMPSSQSYSFAVWCEAPSPWPFSPLSITV